MCVYKLELCESVEIKRISNASLFLEVSFRMGIFYSSWDKTNINQTSFTNFPCFDPSKNITHSF